MKKIEKSMLIFGVMMLLCITAYAQASCVLYSRTQYGGTRISSWFCNDGWHTDISVMGDNGMWEVIN